MPEVDVNLFERQDGSGTANIFNENIVKIGVHVQMEDGGALDVGVKG